jgi:hypothetical protein
MVGGGGKKLKVDFKDVMFFKIKDLQKKRKNVPRRDDHFYPVGFEPMTFKSYFNSQ